MEAKWNYGEEKCVMRNFVTCVLHHIQLGWKQSRRVRWVGHEAGTRKLRNVYTNSARRPQEKISFCRHRSNIKMDPTQVGCRLDSFFNSVWGIEFFLVNVIINLQTLYNAGIFWLAVWLLTSKDSVPRCRLANDWVNKKIYGILDCLLWCNFCPLFNNQLQFINFFSRALQANLLTLAMKDGFICLFLVIVFQQIYGLQWNLL